MADSANVIIDIAIEQGPVGYAPIDGNDAGGGNVGGGGECVFLGRTRAENHPTLGALRRLEYEAYESMAVRLLNAMAEDVARRHGCLSVRIRHSTGAVAVGEASVCIQVVTAHRAQAFAACREIIDRLKVEVPIWKREVWANGESTWTAATTDAGAAYGENPSAAHPNAAPPVVRGAR